MADVACFNAVQCAGRDDDVDLQPDELGRDVGGALCAARRPAELERRGTAFDPA